MTLLKRLITFHSLPTIKWLLFGLFLLIQVGLNAQSLDTLEKKSKKEGIDYLITLPEGYDAQGSAVPLLLFLHGGDGSNTKHHPKKYASQAGLDFPFMVVAPHCNRGCSWASVDYSSLLSEVLQDFNVDEKRVYITGYSMGGYGTWSAISRYPDLFAAAAPIAGGGNTATICNAKGLAVRAYHGDKDNVTPYSGSKRLIEALKGCGAKAELTTIKGGNHGIWPALFKNQDFYDWLLSHSK